MRDTLSRTNAKWLVGLLPLLLVLGACTTGSIREKTLTVPVIQGATYVGQETCLGCHEDKEAFGASIHGRLADFELMGAEKGCESCHGPGSLHVDGEGDTDSILMMSELSADSITAVCTKCHSDGSTIDWAHSAHEMAGVSCNSCHTIHGETTAKASLKKSDPELCYSCHKEEEGKSHFPSHHPIAEGKMNCSSCHNAHGSEVGAALNTEERLNDLCLNCHTRYQGPFVFGHAPVEDDCTICHDPHGSVANNLLAQNEPFLCLQCHEGHFHITRAGFDPETGTFNDGSVNEDGSTNVRTTTILKEGWDASKTMTVAQDPALATAANPHGSEGFQMSFGTKCTTCHQVVHGSDYPSQPLTGGGLTR